jgi:nitrite reductase/ring-hydroxylating ferredoxin subunit
MTVPRDDLPEKMEWVREGEILKCPWHLWEFDIASGTTIAQPAKRIRTYEVRVEEGVVILRR